MSVGPNRAGKNRSEQIGLNNRSEKVGLDNLNFICLSGYEGIRLANPFVLENIHSAHIPQMKLLVQEIMLATTVQDLVVSMARATASPAAAVTATSANFAV